MIFRVSHEWWLVFSRIVCVSVFFRWFPYTLTEALQKAINIINHPSLQCTFLYILEMISSDESSVNEKLLKGSGSGPEVERWRR